MMVTGSVSMYSKYKFKHMTDSLQDKFFWESFYIDVERPSISV